MAEQARSFLNLSSLNWDDVAEALTDHPIEAFKPMMTRVEPASVEAMVLASKEHLEETGKTGSAGGGPLIDEPLGAPITFDDFAKLDLRYQLGYRTFGRVDETADEFVLPENHLNHTFSLIGRYNRKGYRLRLGGDGLSMFA